MKDWIPKVGDLVTPDLTVMNDVQIFGHTAAYALRGMNFTVVSVDTNKRDMRLDGESRGYGEDGWLYKYWMPAKNQIVINILNDL